MSDDPREIRVQGKSALVEYLEQGARPPGEWRVGIEQERFVHRRQDLGPVFYHGPAGIRSLLLGLTEHGWRPKAPGEPLMGLVRGPEQVSLEPAGQLEHATAPRADVHDLHRDLHSHQEEVLAVAAERQLVLLAMGFEPLLARSALDWMPGERYLIMGDYMPHVGSHGLDMMQRTCALQVNLDFAGEADMVEKFRLALALQPVATALAARSPFADGRPSGYLSYRAAVWARTDPDRCGVPGFVFESGMGFERYVDWALDVPMYSVERGGHHIDTAGQSFRDFLRGRLPALPGELPTLHDWIGHLQTLYPEVRLKQLLELRGTDAGDIAMAAALAAFWAGLLYDADSRGEAWERVRHWGGAQCRRLWLEAPRHGLDTPLAGGTLGDLAQHLVAQAERGLTRRDRRDAGGHDESRYLTPLQEVVHRRESPAAGLLRQGIDAAISASLLSGEGTSGA